jgi:radical SAM superfamily enzyme YgiQ (UPF0313 family)
VAPIGLAYVAGALLERDHEVEVADLCFADEPLETLADQLRRFSPRVVGVALRNVDNAAFPRSVSYLPFAQDVVATVRAQSHATVVLGGSGFSIMPGEFLRRLRADFGVVGEGEETLPRLLDALEAGTNPANIPGVAEPGRSAGWYVPAAPVQRPIPSSRRGWELFDLGRYWRRAGQMPIQSKRGCPFSCVYCTYPSLEGRATRSRAPEDVVDEIERWVAELGINHFFFVDNVFNAPLEHATLVLDELLRRDLRVGWTAYVSPRYTTPAFAELMIRSGCKGVEVGVDGGSAKTMRTLRKGFDVADVRRYFAQTRAAGVRTCATLILGAPGETRETLDETFELMDEVEPAAVLAMVGVRVYPGTAMWPIAANSGQVDGSADPLEPAFYLSEELTEEDLRSVYERARARRNWVMPGADLGVDASVLSRLRDKNIKGPLWRLLRRTAENAVPTDT